MFGAWISADQVQFKAKSIHLSAHIKDTEVKYVKMILKYKSWKLHCKPQTQNVIVGNKPMFRKVKRTQ